MGAFLGRFRVFYGGREGLGGGVFWLSLRRFVVKATRLR